MRYLLLVWALLSAHSAAQPLTVFAASSLTDAFEEMAEAFEAEHPGVEVTLNFAGSSTLRTQILQGAPADVFASADAEQIDRVAEAGLLAEQPLRFTENRLVVITAEGSGVDSVNDLEVPGLLLVLAGPEVPAGRYAREVLTGLEILYGAGFSARVLANLVSNETNVRQAALKVELGEADAALVYVTDATDRTQISVLELPEGYNASADYYLAPLVGNRADGARTFVDFVLSEKGQAILATHGFGS